MTNEDYLCTAADSRMHAESYEYPYAEAEYTVCPNQQCEVTGRTVTHYQYRDGTRWCIDYGCKGCDHHCRFSMC